MKVKITSLNKGVFLSSLLLFLFLLVTVKATASDSSSSYDNSYTNFSNNTINDDYDGFTQSDKFDSVAKKGRNTLSENTLKIKSSSLPTKDNDKTGYGFLFSDSKDDVGYGFYNYVALNYDLLLVSKVKLFLFYSSPKLPSSL